MLLGALSRFWGWGAVALALWLVLGMGRVGMPTAAGGEWGWACSTCLATSLMQRTCMCMGVGICLLAWFAVLDGQSKGERVGWGGEGCPGGDWRGGGCLGVYRGFLGPRAVCCVWELTDGRGRVGCAPSRRPAERPRRQRASQPRPRPGAACPPAVMAGSVVMDMAVPAVTLEADPQEDLRHVSGPLVASLPFFLPPPPTPHS